MDRGLRGVFFEDKNDSPSNSHCMSSYNITISVHYLHARCHCALPCERMARPLPVGMAVPFVRARHWSARQCLACLTSYPPSGTTYFGTRHTLGFGGGIGSRFRHVFGGSSVPISSARVPGSVEAHSYPSQGFNFSTWVKTLVVVC